MSEAWSYKLAEAKSLDEMVAHFIKGASSNFAHLSPIMTVLYAGKHGSFRIELDSSVLETVFDALDKHGTESGEISLWDAVDAEMEWAVNEKWGGGAWEVDGEQEGALWSYTVHQPETRKR